MTIMCKEKVILPVSVNLKREVSEMRIIIILIFSLSISVTQSGQLKVGFDIDDTVLFTEPMYATSPRDDEGVIDYSWINTHDKDYSILIDPTVDLIRYFRSNGHIVYFITAREGLNGIRLAEFLSHELEMDIHVNKNLFFSPDEKVNGFNYTTKHKTFKNLDLDLYYGDSDRDIIAALKADVYPIRVIRNKYSLNSYGNNYFGNTLEEVSDKTPFNKDDLKKFYNKSVGIFGESIYPIDWNNPQH